MHRRAWQLENECDWLFELVLRTRMTSVFRSLILYRDPEISALRESRASSSLLGQMVANRPLIGRRDRRGGSEGVVRSIGGEREPEHGTRGNAEADSAEGAVTQHATHRPTVPFAHVQFIDIFGRELLIFHFGSATALSIQRCSSNAEAG